MVDVRQREDVLDGSAGHQSNFLRTTDERSLLLALDQDTIHVKRGVFQPSSPNDLLILRDPCQQKLGQRHGLPLELQPNYSLTQSTYGCLRISQKPLTC